MEGSGNESGWEETLGDFEEIAPAAMEQLDVNLVGVVSVAAVDEGNVDHIDVVPVDEANGADVGVGVSARDSTVNVNTSAVFSAAAEIEAAGVAIDKLELLIEAGKAAITEQESELADLTAFRKEFKPLGEKIVSCVVALNHKLDSMETSRVEAIGVIHGYVREFREAYNSILGHHESFRRISAAAMADCASPPPSERSQRVVAPTQHRRDVSAVEGTPDSSAGRDEDVQGNVETGSPVFPHPAKGRGVRRGKEREGEEEEEPQKKRRRRKKKKTEEKAEELPVEPQSPEAEAVVLKETSFELQSPGEAEVLQEEEGERRKRRRKKKIEEETEELPVEPQSPEAEAVVRKETSLELQSPGEAEVLQEEEGRGGRGGRKRR